MIDCPIAKKFTANQREKLNVENYIQWVTTLSLTMRLAVVAFQIYGIPRSKFSENSNLYSSSRSSILMLIEGSYATSVILVREIIFTARCTLVQSAVLRSHVVCLSVRLSVCL